jgi:hypothetical protein
MPENYFVALRRVQKQNLLNFMQAELLNNSKASIKELLARFSLKTGYKTATLEQWVQELKDAGAII